MNRATKEMMLPRFVPSSKSMGTLRYISRLEAHLRYPRRIGAGPIVGDVMQGLGSEWDE